MIIYMSLAVLARKTKTKMRSKSTKCGGITNGSRTKGHILNMTNRGGGIGLSGMSYKYRGSGCRSGAAETCCSANKTVSAKCRQGCSCRFGGLSQPAPQMSYRTYLNRKSNGAYRPSGRNCCGGPITAGKNPNTWKQHPNIPASDIVEHRKQSTIRCAKGLEVRKQNKIGDVILSNKLDARPVCSYKDPVTGKYETVKNCNPYGTTTGCKNSICAVSGGKIWGRLTYTRINHNWCNTTKSVEQGNSASDHIGKVKQRAFLCKCTKKCTNNGTSKSPECFRYCYPKPMATSHCPGSLSVADKTRIACLRNANSTC